VPRRIHRTQFFDRGAKRSARPILDRRPRNDSEKAQDSFCASGNGRGLIEPGLTSGLAKPNAAEAADYWRRYLTNDCQSDWASRARRSLNFCEMQINLIASA
jgi:hypothetical protein